MLYQVNKEMVHTQVDETTLSAFNPKTGDIYFFDAQGIEILRLLGKPCSLEGLLLELCEVYEDSLEAIKTDVEEFLAEAIENKIVVELPL